MCILVVSGSCCWLTVYSLFSPFRVKKNTHRYGGERYEKRDLQLRVREVFRRLQTTDDDTTSNIIPWTIIDASQTIEQVHHDIWDVASATVSTCPTRPIGTMFPNNK
jgi:thymidylate kinase